MITLATKWKDIINPNEIVSIKRDRSIQYGGYEYIITFADGRRINFLGDDLTREQIEQIAKAKDKQRFMPDPIFVVKKKPKRLRCEYCGRIATTERPTCEGCGAVLPWEIDYEA